MPHNIYSIKTRLSTVMQNKLNMKSYRDSYTL